MRNVNLENCVELFRLTFLHDEVEKERLWNEVQRAAISFMRESRSAVLQSPDLVEMEFLALAGVCSLCPPPSSAQSPHLDTLPKKVNHKFCQLILV